MLTPGTRFGPYEIGEPIGSGGMGEVYRARDARLDRVVALKVLPTALGANSQALQRFEREARAIAALNHPNICTIHDVGEAPDSSRTRFIVMELLEGETLRQRLSRGPLDPATLVDVAVALTSALDAAHKKGIDHRDLKPSNIFLVDAARGGGVRLLDFGLVKLMGARPLTRQGMVAGSPSYIAPEAWRGNPTALDHRIDIYSFAVIVFRVLAARVPFETTDLMEKLRLVTTAARPSLHAIRPDLHPDVDVWVEQALAVNPDSAEALATRGALAVLTIRAERDPAGRTRAAEGARETLERAFSLNGLLRRGYGRYLEEANRL